MLDKQDRGLTFEAIAYEAGGHTPAISSVISVTSLFLYLAQHNNERSYGNLADSVEAVICLQWPLTGLHSHLFPLSFISFSYLYLQPATHILASHSSQTANFQQPTTINQRTAEWTKYELRKITAKLNMAGMVQQCSVSCSILLSTDTHKHLSTTVSFGFNRH